MVGRHHYVGTGKHFASAKRTVGNFDIRLLQSAEQRGLAIHFEIAV